MKKYYAMVIALVGAMVLHPMAATAAQKINWRRMRQGKGRLTTEKVDLIQKTIAQGLSATLTHEQRKPLGDVAREAIGRADQVSLSFLERVLADPNMQVEQGHMDGHGHFLRLVGHGLRAQMDEFSGFGRLSIANTKPIDINSIPTAGEPLSDLQYRDAPEQQPDPGSTKIQLGSVGPIWEGPLKYSATLSRNNETGKHHWGASIEYPDADSTTLVAVQSEAFKRQLQELVDAEITMMWSRPPSY